MKLDHEAFIIDLDGCVYRGNTIIPGADRAISELRRRGKRILFLTNNSTETPEGFARRLRAFGIESDPSLILTSAVATAMYMRRLERGTAYVVGEEGLRLALEGEGFRVVEHGEAESAKYVVSGLDRKLTYAKIAAACSAIFNGARYIATNADPVLPFEGGYLPGAGAILSMISAVTGQKPLVIGKPSKRIISMALRKLGASSARTALVGDVLDIDIMAGKRAGLFSILLLSGVSRREDVEKSRLKPDLVLEDLSKVLDYL